MIEVKVHIYTDGDFVLPSDSIELDEEFEYYSARRFFNTNVSANEYIDNVFSLINSAKNDYGQHQGLIDNLHKMDKYTNYLGERVNNLESAVYLTGNQEIEIEVKHHNKTKEEWWSQRLNDIREEYFSIYGVYPK